MNFIAWMIIACEIGFWVVISLGLFTRYILKKNKLGLFFLALTPVIDLILLITASYDLYKGATATIAHAIAAVYLGVSIVYGKSMINWADERFRYYVIKVGPKPAELFGMEYTMHYLKGWGKHVLSYLIGSGLLVLVINLVNDSVRTEAMLDVLKGWTIVVGIDFLFAISYFIWPKKKKG